MGKTTVKLSYLIAAVTLVACSSERGATPLPGSQPLPPAYTAPHWQSKPVAVAPVEHPYMAPAGRNSMHSDSYNSDVHHSRAPTASAVVQSSRLGAKRLGGQCATNTFTGDGKLILLCAKLDGFRIQLLQPRTLELLAEYRMPVRSSSYQALLAWDRSIIMNDSSGAYFYLDDQDRVVLVDNLNRILRLGHRQLAGGEWEFYLDRQWDLSGVVPSDCLRPTNPFASGECDMITAVLPDHTGDLWWASRYGRIGTVDTSSGRVAAITLAGEEVQNGFAVAADGVYLVSDHALYALDKSPDGNPLVRWREPYDRGSGRKVGSINQGSGNTPTLFSRYLTITDNAVQQINLLIYERLAATDRLVCQVPLFIPGGSATDNSMIAYNHTVIVENNAGYSSVYGDNDWSLMPGGVERIDVDPATGSCTTVWRSAINAPSSVPKLAASIGVAYFYAFALEASGERLWSLVGLDVHSGETVVELPTGYGAVFNNNWAPITLAPDGTAYVVTSRGILALWQPE
ncbi:hypothetical protein E3W66_02290 [Gammaproteobacteria bacterium LSUCC0057]|uniref:Pyrrolo-quinoline quinone n=1 Tax=Gammaproteobacteria bacterium LSUCC0057 TaxID=2559237 RepID=A0A4Y8UKN0_9GAMM|nr:hypothetical protein E3W66_02290 [Gammaproteobacteria bacterium LSUCC0057]